MLFQLVLTKFVKSELFSCLPTVDHVIKSCKEPIDYSPNKVSNNIKINISLLQVIINELHPFSREELYSTGLPPGNFFFLNISMNKISYSLFLCSSSQFQGLF